MDNVTEYKVLRKALELIETHTKEELQNKFQLIEHGEVHDIIIDDVCQSYNVTLEKMQSKTRLRSIVDARQVCMYLLRKFTNMSYRDIGLLFGRDHSTAIHACKSVEGNAYYGDYKYKVEKIEKRLNALYDTVQRNNKRQYSI
jgi:chromosomal replication initiation ATPase DnaA